MEKKEEKWENTGGSESQGYEEKKKKLYEKMYEYARQELCVAFSGGVDSSLLLKLAKVCARGQKGKGEPEKRVYAVTFDTVLHPACDLENARQVARETGVWHEVLYVNELEGAGIRYNPVNRCYLCKKTLFSRLRKFAEQRGIQIILEGSNEDDLHVYRPGLQAVRELGILSPLAECGFTKDEVRRLAKELGISAAKRPSVPCLATRLPYGTEIKEDVLEKIGRGEAFLRDLGFPVVRLRLHGDVARIEIPREDFAKFTEEAALHKIRKGLKALGFSYLTLDIQGFRSGSMDENINFIGQSPSRLRGRGELKWSCLLCSKGVN